MTQHMISGWKIGTKNFTVITKEDDMKKLNNHGYIDSDAAIGLGAILIVVMILVLMVLAIFSKWEWSEDNVSGIVYNTTNNAAVSGATHFKVRASVDTYVDPDANESAYCLPANSPYKELVNQAAADKNIKVQVTTRKGFWIKAPWSCVDNVKVERVN